MRRAIMLAILPLATSCAPQDMGTAVLAAGDGQQDCFFGSQVDGFRDAGPDTVQVRMAFREGYELTLSPGCPSVSYAMGIGIVSRGTDRICTGRPAQLVIPQESGRGAQRCLVRSIRKLTPQEFAVAWNRPPAD